MRSYVRARDPNPLREELGSGAMDVARVVSEIRERIGVEPRPAGADPEEDRWRLLHAATSFLRNAAAERPIVLVLEDLHWADLGTLDLLLHVARNLDGSRLLVVGTYRDVEVDRAHPLSGSLAELRRVGRFDRIALRGLTVDEVHRMMTQIRGQDVPWSRAEAIHRQTEGNPLFVQEVLRYIVEEGIVVREGGRWVRADDGAPDSGIPEGLRDVIGKRLSRLSSSCNQLLSVAAVIGRDFGLETLQRVTEMDEESVYTALEEALRIGIVQERSQPGTVWYRFAHAFFRQTLYEEMIAPRRLRLHQQVARALEAQYAARLDEHAPELAEHYAHSTDAADLAKAVHYGELAAQRAAAVYAYGEAARHLEQALHVQMVLDPDDRARRCDLLLALGEALLPTDQMVSIPENVSEPAFQIATDLADRARAGAAAVLALEAMAHHASNPNTYRSEVFQRWSGLADQYTDEGSSLRVYAHVHAGMARLFVEGPAAAHVRLRQAVDAAEALGSNQELYLAAGWAFRHLLAMRDLPTLERLALMLVDRPREGARAVDIGVCLRYLGSWFLGSADRSRAESLWGQLTNLARNSHDVTLQRLALEPACILSFLDGDLEGTIRGCAERRDAGAETATWGWLQEVWNRSLAYSGRHADELEEISAEPARTRPQLAGRAVLLTYLGQHDEAKQILAGFDGLESAEDESALAILLALLEVATALKDRASVESLYRRLESLDRVLPGKDSHFVSFQRQLGDCDRFLGRLERARDHYLQSIEECQRIGFRPDLALTRLALAELLLDHFPKDGAQALRYLDEAIAEFQAMRMQPALERALRRKLEIQGAAGANPGTSIDALTVGMRSSVPDLRPHAAPDGTVTLLFTDIESSTELTVELGDLRWLQILRAHHALVREQVQKHGGFEVKSQGDGFMLAFQSARRALDCALAIQRAIAATHTDPVIRVRMGLHTGEALKDADDFHGRDVVLAARIADKAKGGEILVSEVVRTLVESRTDIRFGNSREAELKGLAGVHRMYEIDWQ
jgi:class 3 adenylate cyclase